jgi:subtilase family serine protease
MASKFRSGLPLAILFVAALEATGFCGLKIVSAQSVAPASRISADWQSANPQALAAPTSSIQPDVTDLGPAPANARLDRVLVLLAPSPAQQRALTDRLQSVETAGSVQYHQWLTPSAFAENYSNSASDVSAVVTWLQSEGFEHVSIPAGRGWIEVSGSVAQVERAFSTSIHLASSSAGPRFILASSISVPAPIAPLVQGIASLDGALSVAALTDPQPLSLSAADLNLQASSSHPAALTPRLFSPLLHLDALHSAGTDGASELIAIPSRSNVNPRDVAEFRDIFDLSPSPLVVLPDGPDPGRGAEQAAATLTASWAGAAAPGAQILLVPAASTSATDGLDLALASIVDRALAHTVVVGYSVCEAGLSPTHQALYAALYRQAAAEGIAIISASGDSGPSACTRAGSLSRVDAGFGVNALASTPWDTAVGAAAFSSDGVTRENARLSAWSPVNVADPAYASGGGRSSLYSAPAWQSTTTPASTGAQGRSLPDLALPTALDNAVNPGLAFCFSGSSTSTGCTLYRAGGSSASAAIFAGVAALIAQKYGAQGNLSPGLYQLSRTAGVFSDINLGSARLPCLPGSGGCDEEGFIGFSAAPGYDLATGLGSLDAHALVSRWHSLATGTGAVTVNNTINGGQVINAGGSLALSGNVVSDTGGPAPTGIVTFYDLTTSTDLADVTLIPGVGGTSNASQIITGVLGLGAHNIVVDYGGDTVYAGNYSPAVLVEVESSTTNVVVTTNSPTYAPGAAFVATATITSPNATAGAPPPTGTVTFTLDGVTQGVAPVVTGTPSLATLTLTSPLTSGSHQIVATYSGDTNYAASTSLADVITVNKNPPIVVLTSNLATVPPGQTLVLTATVTPTVAPAAGAEQNPTGAVIFYNGTTILGTVNLGPSGSGDSSFATLTTQTVTGGDDSIYAFYQGDTVYGSANSNSLAIDVQTITITPAAQNPPTNLDIQQGGQGSVAFNIAALGGYAGPVQIVCSVPSQDDMTCTPTPQDVTPPVNVTFVVQTFTAGQSSNNSVASRGQHFPIWPRAAGGTALAALAFFLLPFGRRARVFSGRRARRFLVLLFLLAGLGGAGIGCQSGGSQLASFGTPLGVATLTVTASENVNNTVVSQSVYFTVNVTQAGASN